MAIDSLAIIAGTVSSVIFVSSHIPMLLKAYRTGDLRSYSALNLIMVNIGNLIYWLYVSSLPAGPLWILHTFYTVSSASLLAMYFRMLMKEFAKRKQRQIEAETSQLEVILKFIRSAVSRHVFRVSGSLNLGSASRFRRCVAGC